MRIGPRKMHRMSLTVETKTQHGGCLKHVCEECRADVHALASIAERLAAGKSRQDGVPSPLLEETYELIVRLGLVRERINPQWGPPPAMDADETAGARGAGETGRETA